MPLSSQFLEELRDRTSLSGLIGASVVLKKHGNEHRACCPFHNEKTPSFYVNDDKGFYHCFGCGAHGDAIRWMTDRKGLGFIDAVKALAASAGLVVPAPSPDAARRETVVTDAAGVLDRAAGWYATRLRAEPRAYAQLEVRGVTEASIDRFGLGFAPGTPSVAMCGVPPASLAAAGLMLAERDGFRDRFARRIMIPIHDQRGRTIGFGGRAVSDRQDAKYINSAEGEHFDKGRTLYNLHRAAPAAREARRLIVVEGYLDVIALDQVGIGEVVAPMGTAITEAQLVRAWRVHHCPTLLLDGDSAGVKAALRACERAMPAIGPGASLSIARLPAGVDPDDLARNGGRDAIEAVLADAMPLADFVFEQMLEAA